MYLVPCSSSSLPGTIGTNIDNAEERDTVKKFWIILLCLAAAAAAAFLIWSISGYLLSERDRSPAAIPAEVRFTLSEAPPIGAVAEFRCEFKLPRFRQVTSLATTPGKGTVISRTAAVRKIKSAWKYDTYLLSGAVCCLRAGESSPGTITLEISPADEKQLPEKCTVKIPSLKILDLAAPVSPEPELAGNAPQPQKSFNYYHLLWLLLLLLPLLLLLLKKGKKTAPPLSLRRRTLNALDALCAEVYARRLSAREGIAGVSDLLRNYLEERFSLPASRKTTPEFLEELEFNTAIPRQADTFLRNFLNAADMIKFAQAPCDAAAVSTAVKSAVELVENTSLPEKEEK